MTFYKIGTNIIINKAILLYVAEYMFRTNVCQARTLSMFASSLVHATVRYDYDLVFSMIWMPGFKAISLPSRMPVVDMWQLAPLISDSIYRVERGTGLNLFAELLRNSIPFWHCCFSRNSFENFFNLLFKIRKVLF